MALYFFLHDFSSGEVHIFFQKQEWERHSKQTINGHWLVVKQMGCSGLGCFGSEVQTPNIDAIAADGLLYNNFTVCSASSPTRTSLLTGRDNNAVGMGSIANMVFGPDRPETQGRIDHRAGTIAQILKKRLPCPFQEICLQDREYKPMESPSNRSHFRYLPRMGHLGCDADPHIENCSHTITIPIHRDSTEQEGVLVAAGGNTGGYTLYIMDNRLVYEFNHFRKMFRVAADKPLPPGDCTVRFGMKRAGQKS